MAAPYWVIDIGPIVNDQYDYAVVSDNKKLSLFILARDVNNFMKYYNNDVLKTVNDFGFTKVYNKPRLQIKIIVIMIILHHI